MAGNGGSEVPKRAGRPRQGSAVRRDSDREETSRRDNSDRRLSLVRGGAGCAQAEKASIEQKASKSQSTYRHETGAALHLRCTRAHRVWEYLPCFPDRMFMSEREARSACLRTKQKIR